MYKEYTRPLEQQIDTDKNIFSVLDERANRTPNDSLVEYKNEHGEWSSFSATEFRAKVIAIAKGLIAQGIMPGESVSIISHTCWQWTALDVAIMSIGALTVPVYETNSPAQVKMIFNDANVKMAFAEDDAQRDKIESIRNECSNLGDVYVIGLGDRHDDRIRTCRVRRRIPRARTCSQRIGPRHHRVHLRLHRHAKRH